MQNEIPEDDGHCVITGCIARGLLLKPTFAGSWSPDRTDLTSEQKYELTVPYAQIMSTRLKGQPLMTEHDEDNGSVGEILHCWIDENNDWYMQAVVDRSTRAGNDIIKGMLSETFGEQVCELSLSHEGFKPREVSIVKKGARDGSTVEKIEIVNADGLAAIKNQEYKVEIPEIPEHFPADTPRICASFANKMSTYTAVRNPTPPVTYANTAHAPSEAVPILNQVNQMRQQNQSLLAQQQMAEKQQQMQQQQQAQTPKEDDEQTLLKKLNDLRARQQPQTPAQMQFANLTQKLSQPADANNPANTGNIHTMHTNPEDDKLMQIAGMFEGRNMLSKEQMEVGKGALLDVAAKSKATRDALAQKEAELEALRQKNADLEQKVNHHEGDLLKQKRQAAALLRKVLTKTNPPLTQQEEKDMNSGENDFANGQTDRAMKQFEPFLIRASALIDAAESAQNVEAEQANVGGAGLNLLGEMQKILNPSSALVQASYHGKHGQKRGYDSMASSSAAAPAASSARGNIWQDSGMQYHHPKMGALLQQMEASRGGDDTITLGELQPNRFQRR